MTGHEFVFDCICGMDDFQCMCDLDPGCAVCHKPHHDPVHLAAGTGEPNGEGT